MSPVSDSWLKPIYTRSSDMKNERTSLEPYRNNAAWVSIHRQYHLYPFYIEINELNKLLILILMAKTHPKKERVKLTTNWGFSLTQLSSLSATIRKKQLCTGSQHFLHVLCKNVFLQPLWVTSRFNLFTSGTILLRFACCHLSVQLSGGWLLW